MIKNGNNENVPHLEITEVILVTVMLSTIIINRIQEPCIHLLLINLYFKIFNL